MFNFEKMMLAQLLYWLAIVDLKTEQRSYNPASHISEDVYMDIRISLEMDIY